MAEFDDIVNAISQATNTSLGAYTVSSLGGGSINSSYLLKTEQQQYFFKTNQSHLLAMFEAEAQGLSELASFNAVKIPEVICLGATNRYSYIVLEYIECRGMGSEANQQLGQQLAQLHQHQKDYFGWHIDNTIGSTPQFNDRNHDWVSFLQTQRYGAQLDFIQQNGFGSLLYDKGQRLISELPEFFTNYQPHPSLLHGDLWSGNAASDEQGQPLIFDPACYYGDREADIAMTELFGGFSQAFYHAYNAEYPLDPGYKTRKTLYNLYHILNHANLFGGGYASQASNMIDQLLAEI